MSDKKSHRKTPAVQPSCGKHRVILAAGILLGILSVGGGLTQWASRRPADRPEATGPNPQAEPASFAPGSPSKEYIYAGGRLVATDEPTGFSPASQAFAANGGAGTITVLSNTSWTASVTSGSGWITITGGGSGTGNGQVSFSVATHNDPNNRRVGAITIAGKEFAVLQGQAFSDVGGNPYYTEIGKLSARSVAQGPGGGTYGPNAPVLRDQMAKFIIGALGDLNPPPPPAQRFTDVPPSNVFYNFIEQMALRKITVGCSTSPPQYCPGATVTHEQMAAFLIRARGEHYPWIGDPAQGGPPQRFGDVTYTNIFYGFIERMGAIGIWPGCQPAQMPPLYCPANAVTRSQMAYMLVRAFNL